MAPGIVLPFAEPQRAPKTQAARGVTLVVGNLPEIITHYAQYPCPWFTLGLLPRTPAASSRKKEGTETPIATVCV